jgi:uncharacterized small protein (TIGR04563 family)
VRFPTDPTDRYDPRKLTLYFPRDMLAELDHEAARLGRSKSWVVQQAFRVGVSHVRRLPAWRVPDEVTP